MTHRRLVNAFRSTSHLTCASMKGFKTLHKQWLSLCAIHHLICCTGIERVPKIGHFMCNLRDNVGGNRHGGVTHRQMDAVWSSSHLYFTPKESFETLHKYAMDDSRCSRLSHLPYWEDTNNLAFCVQFEHQRWWKFHGMVTCKWHKGDVRSTSHLSYVSKEGFETLHEQWTTLFTVYSISVGTLRG